MRFVFGLASVISLSLAVLMVRAAYRMNKRAKMGRLAASLIDFMNPDLQDSFKLLEQTRGFRSPFQDGGFTSSLFNYYAGALILAAFGLFAAALVIRDLYG